MVEVSNPRQGAKFQARIDRLEMTHAEFAKELDIDERHVRRMCAGKQAVRKVVWMAIDSLELRGIKGTKRKAA